MCLTDHVFVFTRWILHFPYRVLQGTAGAAAGGPPQKSGLAGISGIKVDPRDFEETTKRCVCLLCVVCQCVERGLF